MHLLEKRLEKEIFDTTYHVSQKMTKRPIDPRITNIFIDTCAFDPKYSPEDKAAMDLFELYEKGKIILNIAHSTQKEINYPNTPGWVKQQARSQIYTIKTRLTDIEKRVEENGVSP